MPTEAMKLRSLPVLALAAAAACVAVPAFTATAQVEVPTLVNYQGYLTNDNGDPLGAGSAMNFDIQFRLYDAGTGGQVLWGEQQTVTVLDGRFSVLLGNGIDISQSVPHGDLADLFRPGDGAAEVVFLGITVNNEGQTGEPELVPRQQLVSNPFSLRAKIADAVHEDAISSVEIANGSITGVDIAASTITGAKIVDASIAPVDTTFAQGNSVNLVLFPPGRGPSGPSMSLTLIPGAEGYHPLLTLTPNPTPPFEPKQPVFGIRNYVGTDLIPQPFPLPPIPVPTFESSFYLQNAPSAPGRAVLGDNGSWSASSDERLKTDIEPASGLLERALALDPVRYRFRSSPEGSAPDLGFTAQDVGEQFPELVTTGESWTLNYAGLSTVAIGAIKEQHDVIEAQSEEIEALKRANEALAARLERLEAAILAK